MHETRAFDCLTSQLLLHNIHDWDDAKGRGGLDGVSGKILGESSRVKLAAAAFCGVVERSVKKCRLRGKVASVCWWACVIYVWKISTFAWLWRSTYIFLDHFSTIHELSVDQFIIWRPKLGFLIRAISITEVSRKKKVGNEKSNETEKFSTLLRNLAMILVDCGKRLEIRSELSFSWPRGIIFHFRSPYFASNFWRENSKK